MRLKTFHVFLYYRQVLLLLLFLLSVSLCKSQTGNPGGVDGIIYWFKTVKGSGTSFTWADANNKRYTLSSFAQSQTRNINFWPAVYFPGTASSAKPTANLHNAELFQGTLIAAFYPTYESGALSPASNVFFKLNYNGKNAFSYSPTTVLGINGPLSYGTPGSNFMLPDQKGLVRAMKVGLYTYGELPENLSNSWGTDKEIAMPFDFQGFIPEFLVYRKKLEKDQIQRLQSYFSIKYGLTQDVNYLNSDNGVIWDVLVNFKYHHRVAAIGKDIVGAISQPVSNTTYEELLENQHSYFYNANDLTKRSLTIGFPDSVFTKVPDKHFVFWGDDQASIQTNDYYELDPHFPGLFTAKREWLLQNGQNTSQSTSVTVGGPVFKELSTEKQVENIDVACYFLVKLDGTLDTKDIFPFKNGTGISTGLSIPWTDGNTKFTFARAEKLRFMVREASKNVKDDRKDCNQLFEMRENLDFDDVERKDGKYYYRQKFVLNDCINRLMYRHKPDSLLFFAKGGIGDYQCSIKKKDTGTTIITTPLKVRFDGEPYGLAVKLLPGEYLLELKDRTNQLVKMPVIIRP